MSEDINPFDFSVFDDEPVNVNEEVSASEVIPDVTVPVELTHIVVDERFAALVEEYGNDEEVLRNAASILEAEDILTKAESAKAELEDEAALIEAELQDLERRRIKLANRKAGIKTQIWDIRSTIIIPTAKEKETKERALRVAKEQQVVAQRQKFQSSRLEEIASQFPWYNGFEGVDGKTWKILPHQFEGAKFLHAAKRAILGDDMGVGKTLTAIAALDLNEAKRVLIIAPSDITANFISEVQEWAGHRPVLNIKGMTKQERNLTLKFMREGLNEYVVITNYEAWRKDFSLLTTMGDMAFDSLVIDEAHTLKDTTSVAYKGVASILETKNVCPVCPGNPFMPTTTTGHGDLNLFRRCVGCGWEGQGFTAYDDDGNELGFEEKVMLPRSIKNVTVMTGTPILNSPLDLFALLSIVDPANFPAKEKKRFLNEYCIQDPLTGRYGFHEGGLEYLTKHRLRGIYLARTKKDAGIVLPPQKPIKHLLELTADQYPDQRRVVDQLNKYAEIILSDGRTLSTIAIIALITRQRQANVFPGGIQLKDPDTGEIILSVSEEVNESIKIDKAVAIIREQVAQGERVVLFSQFTTALEEVERRLAEPFLSDDGVLNVRAVTLTGKTKPDIKEQVKTNFDRKRAEVPKWDVVLANYKSGGVGLNFTAATHSIILDREWNPGKENQALARTDRIGQTEETFVHIIEVEDSIDTWMNGIISQKDDLIDGFVTSSRDMQEEYLKAFKSGDIK